jgi:hypothetical protein
MKRRGWYVMLAVAAVNNVPRRQPFSFQQIQDRRLMCGQGLSQFRREFTRWRLIAELAAPTR